jgi:hypothetical protein
MFDIISLFRAENLNEALICKIDTSLDLEINVRMDYKLIHSNIRINIVGNGYDLDVDNQN